MPRRAFWPSRSDLNCTRERMLRKPVLHMPWLQADYGGQVYFRESEKVKVTICTPVIRHDLFFFQLIR